jgi:hypothetical protein
MATGSGPWSPRNDAIGVIVLKFSGRQVRKATIMCGHPGASGCGEGETTALSAPPFQVAISRRRRARLGRYGVGRAFWAVFRGNCLSNTSMQALLRLDFLAFMQAMMRSTLGISELQSRKTSGVQAARSLSVPRACPAVGYKTKDIAIRAANKPVLLSLTIERPCVAIMTVSPVRLLGRLRVAASWLEPLAALPRVFVVFANICVPLPL